MERGTKENEGRKIWNEKQRMREVGREINE